MVDVQRKIHLIKLNEPLVSNNIYVVYHLMRSNNSSLFQNRKKMQNHFLTILIAN